MLMKAGEQSLLLPARQPEELVEHPVNGANQAGEVALTGAGGVHQRHYRV